MFTDWNVYYQPLHLNNVTGVSIPDGDYGNPDTTPFIMLAEANGGTYIPKSTNYMDVYSGGSPFTFTQELVQRGAEVQVDTFRIAIVGTTFAQCKERMQLLRTALNNQHMFGPQILSIKLSHQTTYTEWFVHGAVIQEEETMLGRDIIDQSNPVLYARVDITRSPYGADRNAQYEHTEYVFNSGSLITSSVYNVLDYNELYGAYVNVSFNIDYEAEEIGIPNTFGPIVFATVINDTFIANNTVQSGTLTAGGSASLNAVNYYIQEVTNNYPLQVFVVADVQDNLVEMRLDINGYKTAYVRAIGSHINSTNGTDRLFVLPTIDISTLFNGAKEYAVYYELPVIIELRNLNRGGTTTYNVQNIRICRIDNMIQTYPTSDYSSFYDTPSLIKVNVFSFYDTIEYPTQPMPVLKAIANKQGIKFNLQDAVLKESINQQYLETLEVRGTFVRLKQQYGSIRFIVFQLSYDCRTNPLFTTSLRSITFKYAPAYLSIKE